MADTTEYMITTFDNPFNPWTEYDAWLQWDTLAGYNTPGFLARRVFSSNDLSEPDQELAIQQAIEELVQENVNGMFRKVTKESFDRLK